MKAISRVRSELDKYYRDLQAASAVRWPYLWRVNIRLYLWGVTVSIASAVIILILLGSLLIVRYVFGLDTAGLDNFLIFSAMLPLMCMVIFPFAISTSSLYRTDRFMKSNPKMGYHVSSVVYYGFRILCLSPTFIAFSMTINVIADYQENLRPLKSTLNFVSSFFVFFLCVTSMIEMRKDRNIQWMPSLDEVTATVLATTFLGFVLAAVAAFAALALNVVWPLNMEQAASVFGALWRFFGGDDIIYFAKSHNTYFISSVLMVLLVSVIFRFYNLLAVGGHLRTEIMADKARREEIDVALSSLCFFNLVASVSGSFMLTSGLSVLFYLFCVLLNSLPLVAADFLLRGFAPEPGEREI